MAKLKIVGRIKVGHRFFFKIMRKDCELRPIHHKIALQSQKSYIDLMIVIKPMKSPHDDLFLNIKKNWLEEIKIK